MDEHKMSAATIIRGSKLAYDEDSAPRHAIVFPKPHGMQVATGEKITMISPVDLEKYANQNLFLAERQGKNFCLQGIVRFEPAEPIEIEKIAETEDEHKISECEARKRWPDSKKLRSYRLFPVTRFPHAVQVYLLVKSPHPYVVEDIG